MVLTEFDENKYAEILREDGRIEGELLQLCRLVSKKTISVDTALEEAHLSEDEFFEIMEKYGFSTEKQ